MDSDWRPNAHYPDLSAAPRISVDVETNDPNLETLGPGGVRHDGFVAGVAVAVPGWAGYYPIRHGGGDNLPEDTVFRWLNRELSRANQPKVGHHIIYDLEWLRAEGVQVAGSYHCTNVREALIDENQDAYDLSSCLIRHGHRPKDESLLYQYGYSQGLRPKTASTDQVKQNLWKFPARYVGPYATQDAASALELFDSQTPILTRNGLDEVLGWEVRFTKLLLEMRFRGVPVDIEKAEAAIKELYNRQRAAQAELNQLCGFEVDVWSPTASKLAVEKAGLTPPKTEKGNPSVTADWLELQNTPITKLFVRVRKLDRAGSVFIQKKIIDCSYKGYIYPEFYQTMSERYGTRSGRLSSANPNLQQVPKRNEELAKIIRSCFGNEAGKLWGAFDYSQQEPRIAVHYAALRQLTGAEEARRRYIEDPSTDYHDLTRSLILERCGKNLDRRTAKDINLGIFYTMGALKLCKKVGLPTIWVGGREMPGPEGVEILKAYHIGMPFVKELINDTMRVCRQRGYIRTALGRRSNLGSRFAHKACNRIMQGGAADMTKVAMVVMHENLNIVPYCTVHDEVDTPLTEGDEAREAKQVEEIMMEAGRMLGITVPMKVDTTVGKTWGDGKALDVAVH